MRRSNRTIAAVLTAAGTLSAFGVGLAIAGTGTTETTGTTGTTAATTAPTATTAGTTTTAATTTGTTTAAATTGTTETTTTTGTTATTSTTEKTGTTAKPATARISASLSAGQERPLPTGARKAKGSFAATLADDGKLTYRLAFKNLTGGAVAAHIHSGKRGVAGPVVATLCAKACTSPLKGTVTVNASVKSALRAGTAYVNVHTAANPAGEIRGQITIAK